jgi:hypothetical protein
MRNSGEISGLGDSLLPKDCTPSDYSVKRIGFFWVFLSYISRVYKFSKNLGTTSKFQTPEG